MGKQTDKEILNGVIIGFRNLIAERYQYDNIRSKYEIPESFDAERVDRYRHFFWSRFTRIQKSANCLMRHSAVWTITLPTQTNLSEYFSIRFPLY